ncbi:MAG: hypothetical protein V4721_16520 [Bacteroidota bacterium]
MTTRVILIVLILLILAGAAYTVNKLREMKDKNKFRLTGYTVSLGLFPSVDIQYDRTDQ